MKEEYSWCFPITEDEIKELWDAATLTVDANVLLDLYRYHKDTRNALLGALKGFKGRAWISHQTAEEFFRNRKKVILSSASSFDDARKKLKEISSSAIDPVNRIKANRIIPDDVAVEFQKSLDAAIEKAGKSIDDAKETHPDFLNKDPILEALSDLFEGSVGDGFTEKEYEEECKEARRRVENNIPPGYLDHKKDGDKPYGDFFMWRQILEYAKSKKCPIIFVTSENKEDWWEKISGGNTTGLHYELQKEAYEASGHRLLAYRTDRFFKYYEDMHGESNEIAAEEISALVKLRSDSSPLVRVVNQSEDAATVNYQEGVLRVVLNRPAYKFTCSGHFSPKLTGVPSVFVDLVGCPEGVPRYALRAGTGTTFDFNIHLKSIEYGDFLPAGEYVFEYYAIPPAEDRNTDDEVKS